jgi:hypothetical protein
MLLLGRARLLLLLLARVVSLLGCEVLRVGVPLVSAALSASCRRATSSAFFPDEGSWRDLRISCSFATVSRE